MEPSPGGLTKRDLERLAALSRIELGPEEEEALLGDLKKILEHFRELQELDTSDVPPMAGGSDLVNVFRGDADRENTARAAGTDAFPEKEGGHLKIPPVFE